MPTQDIHPDDLALLQELNPEAAETAGKTEPVPTTDVPVQEESQSSTLNSSGDSSSSSGTEETNILDNGNQVVDGIEYSADGVEIGAYTEGETQNIEQGARPQEASDPKSEIQDIIADHLPPAWLGSDVLHSSSTKRNNDAKALDRRDAIDEVDKKDKSFNEDINLRQQEEANTFFIESEDYKGFQEDFNLISQPQIEAEASKLVADNPNISEDDYRAHLENFQNDLWTDMVDKSSVIDELGEKAEAYASNKLQPEIDSYYKGRKSALLDIKKNSGDFTSIQELGLTLGADLQSRGDFSFGNAIFQLGTALDKTTENIFGQGIETGHKALLGRIERVNEIRTKQWKNGELSDAEYNKHKTQYDTTINQERARNLDIFIENADDAKINSVLNLASQDRHNENFYTLSNSILGTIDQLPNMLPSQLAGKGGYAGTAVALTMYSLQLVGEYEDKTNRVIGAKMFNVGENELTDEQLWEASVSPEGIKALSGNALAAVIGSVPALASDYVALRGGKIAGSVVGKVLTKSPVARFMATQVQKIIGTTGYKIAKYPARFAVGTGGEIIEEVGQEGIGDLRAHQIRNPEQSSASYVYENLITNGRLTNWNEDYRNLAANTFISAGGTTALSQVVGGTRELVVAKLDKRHILKLSNLTSKEFKSRMDVEKKGLNSIINNPNASEDQKTEAKKAYYNVLDTSYAFNALEEHKNVQGNNRVEAMELLTKRADLNRQIQTLGASGLATQAKEQQKSVDERLDTIQRRSKEGETGSVFDDIRRAVRPKQSVGAARKQTISQKTVNAIEKITNAGGEKVLSGLERLFSRPQGIGTISSTARQLRHLKPGHVSNKEWEGQIGESIKAIENTDQVAEPTLEKDIKATEALDKEAGTEEGKIGARTQAKIEKYFHDQGYAVPAEYSGKFEKEYQSPSFESKVEQGGAVSTTYTNANEAARIQTQAELDRVIGQKEAQRQFESITSSSPTIGLAKRSNLAQSLRNEGFKSNTITKAKSALNREIGQWNKQFLGTKNEAQFRHLLNKLESQLAFIEITDQKVIDLVNKETNGNWDLLTTGIAAYEEAIRTETHNAETLARYSKEAATAEKALKEMYVAGLSIVESKTFDEGVKTGVFPEGYNISTQKFEHTFKPTEYKPAYEAFFGNKASFENLSVNNWYNFLKDLAFIESIQEEITSLDTPNKTTSDVKRLNKLMDQRDKRKAKLEAKNAKLRNVKTDAEVITDFVEQNAPNKDTQEALEAISKHKVAEDTGVVDDTKDRKKVIDNQRPINKKNLLYTDKKTQLETDIVYYALVLANKEISDKGLHKIFRKKGSAFAQAELGLAGLGDTQAERQSIKLLVEEYVTLFGEDSFDILMNQAKEMQYMQDVAQRAIHGSVLAQAALIESINPWLNTLAKKFTPDTFRGTASDKQNKEGFDSITIDALGFEQLKTAAIDGALKAIQNWDPSKGKFITYATSVANGEMKNALDRYTGANTTDTEADYLRQKDEATKANAAKSKIEIAKFLYLKGIDNEQANIFAEGLNTEASDIRSGLNEMAGGESNISSDPRNKPVLGGKLTKLTEQLDKDPRARAAAFAASQIDKLKRLGELKGEDVSHFIGQYEQRIVMLGNPGVDVNNLSPITIPETVLNTRGGYLDSGQTVRLARFNQLNELADPNVEQSKELAVLSKDLTTELELVIAETGGVIGIDQYQVAISNNKVIPQQIKEVEARIEESSFSTKSIMLGRDVDAGVTPAQEEQIQSNQNVVEAQIEVKKKLVDIMTTNNLIQLGAEQGVIQIVGPDGPITKDDALALSPKNEVSTYIQPTTDLKAAVTKALPVILNIGKEARTNGLTEVEQAKLMLVDESFGELRVQANKMADLANKKHLEVIMAEEALGSVFNPNQSNVDGGEFGTDFEHTDNHYDEYATYQEMDDYGESSLYGAEGGFEYAGKSNDSQDAYSEGTPFFTGLDDKSLVEVAEQMRDYQAGRHESSEELSKQMGDLHIARKEAEVLEKISAGTLLIDQYKNEAADGTKLGEMKALIASTKESISEYVEFAENHGKDSSQIGIVNELTYQLLEATKTIDSLMDNTVKIAETKLTPDEAKDLIGPSLADQMKIETTAPSKTIREKAPLSNSGKLYSFAPALIALLPGVGLDIDTVMQAVDLIGTFMDSIMYVADLLFGQFHAMELSMASIIPLGFTKPSSFKGDFKIPFSAVSTNYTNNSGSKSDITPSEFQSIQNAEFASHVIDATETRTEMSMEAFLKENGDKARFVFNDQKTRHRIISNKQRNPKHAAQHYLVFEDQNIVYPIKRYGNKHVIGTLLYLDGTDGNAENAGAIYTATQKAKATRKQRLADQATFYSTMLNDHLFVGSHNKQTVVKEMYDNFGNTLWSNMKEFKKDFQSLTGVNLAKGDTFTTHEISLVKAKADHTNLISIALEKEEVLTKNNVADTNDILALDGENQMEVLQLVAEDTIDGKVPIYNFGTTTKGLAVEQLVTRTGWTVNPRIAEEQAPQGVVMVMRIDPKNLKSSEDGNLDINDDANFPMMHFNSTSATTFDDVIKLNENKICG